MTNKINEKMKELIGRSSFLDYRELWSKLDLKKKINYIVDGDFTYSLSETTKDCFLQFMGTQEGIALDSCPVIEVIMYGHRYGYAFLNENKIYTLADLRERLLKDRENFSLV